jgi:hypothetical protein
VEPARVQGGGGEWFVEGGGRGGEEGVATVRGEGRVVKVILVGTSLQRETYYELVRLP